MSTIKFSAILSFLGQLTDRFSTYGPPRDIAAKFEIASQIEGVQGVELVYPSEFQDLNVTKGLLAQHNLICSTVNVNIKSEAKFHQAGLTHRDPGVRREAVQYLKTAMDISADLGTNMVTCCPLSDGYDYAFETDYTAAWKWFIDGMGEAGAYRDDVRVCIEYKQSEPRHKVIVPNAGTTLAACLQINLPNVGVTMDAGHALYTGEGTAWSVSLLAQAGKLFLVHVNDNYRNWDWDMIPGSVNTWDLVELMFWLGELGYDGWITSDVAPFRIDAVKTVSSTYRSLLWADKVVERIGREELHRIIEDGDPVDALDALQQSVLG